MSLNNIFFRLTDLVNQVNQAVQQWATGYDQELAQLEQALII